MSIIVYSNNAKNYTYMSLLYVKYKTDELYDFIISKLYDLKSNNLESNNLEFNSNYKDIDNTSPVTDSEYRPIENHAVDLTTSEQLVSIPTAPPPINPECLIPRKYFEYSNRYVLVDKTYFKFLLNLERNTYGYYNFN